MTPKKLYSFVSKGEAITWTILITGLILRAVGVDPIVVTIGGSIHGAMFLSYGVIAALVGVNQRWKTSRTIAAVALAIVPFATVPFERSVEKKKLTEAIGAPRSLRIQRTPVGLTHCLAGLSAGRYC
jgi:integral membrane protein